MSDNPFLTQSLTNTVLSRRRFLKWSAALGGTAALVASGLKLGLQPATTASAAAPTAGQEKWVLAACWHNCGGRCVNYALMKDGVFVRQKTDDTHPDSTDYPQQRACARGHAQRYQVFGADRIKYPMKRKNWAPGGGDKSLRGRDEWVRISWDEALNIVSSELKRIKDKYGNRSVFVSGGSEIQRALSLFGGYTGHWGTTSLGTWTTTGPAIGMPSSGGMNDRYELRKSELFVAWGSNPIWSSGGSYTWNTLQAKLGGTRFIFIDPYYNDSIRILGDEWIPIRPTTDHAMMLGMAYVLITEDDPKTNKLIDWEFLNNCTVGFDRQHMPTGADPNENFRDYVLGLDETGKPAAAGHKNYPAKTPQWASDICGVPPNRIRSLALEIATTRDVTIASANAPARVRRSDSWPQMFMTFGAMTGHIGRSGSMTSGGYYHSRYGNGGPALVQPGSSGVTSIANPVKDSINDNEMWDAILNGKYTAGYKDVREINLQAIYHGGGAVLQTRDGMSKGLAAHRKVEFVVSHAQILTTNARYSDVVLPVTTAWERDGSVLTGNREILIWASQVTKPLFEAKDDSWIAVEVGKRLGLDAKQIDPVSNLQQVYSQIAGATIKKIDTPNSQGGYEPLVTITPQDVTSMAEAGVAIKAQSGKVGLQEFMERGVYQVPRKAGDNYEYVAFKEFRDDPVKNKLATATGKFEIHSQALADKLKAFGWEEYRPIPTYNPSDEGYEATFKDFKAKVKGDYPLQLHNTHYLRRAHSVFDNVPHLRRAFPNEFLMNPIDAEARGIKFGDTVLITSKHGKVLRPVVLTDRILPGTVDLFHGAWVEMDEATGIDKAGADNIISGAVPTGQGTSGWNSCIVEVKKWDGKPLDPDYTWPQRIPVKEA
ncbi:MAG: molybdopterin-dependent oxidoreductase [Chloroflexi bacterium]|nr:molybdopterin-dependent oxidoreductase [Chloroflexota bacterium]